MTFEPNDSTASETDNPKRRKWGLWLFFIFIVLPAGLFSLYTWGTLKYVYASGERAGFIQKISQKGWIFKTWEGEMAMVNLPGAMPEKFYFTVRHEDVAKRIEQNLGDRVVLHYNEHRGIPTRIFGDTTHFVTDVRPVENAVAPAPLPAQNIP